LQLEPTQLRIARHMAASGDHKKPAGGSYPETARILDGAIVIEPAGPAARRPQVSSR
jgi:hypothetical protein